MPIIKPTKDMILWDARKNEKDYGIHTGEDFHTQLVNAAGGYAQLLKFCSLNNVKCPSRKNVRNNLTFQDPDGRLLAWHGGVVNKLFGQPRRAELSPKSIMDVEYTITTAKRDRDGDVLRPIGAKIDKGMPFLLHHLAEMPVGALIEVLHQDEKKVDLASCIADTQLGHDAATLVEVGAFRTSHGFTPLEYEPLCDEKGNPQENGGWHIKSYEMMESSLVTIPSNTDAIITAYSRLKLHHPTMKLWAGHLTKSRNPSVVSGFEAKSMSKVNNEKVASEIAAEEGKFYGMSVLDGAWYVGTKEELEKIGVAEPKSGKGNKPMPGTKDAVVPGKKADDEEGKKIDEEKLAEDDKKEEKTEANDDAGSSVLLIDIRALIKKLSKADLPDEALDRLVVIDGMLKAVESALADQSKAIAQAAKKQDLPTMLEEVQSLVGEVAKKLSGMLVEMGNILAIEGMSPDSASQVQEVGDRVQTLLYALSEAAGMEASAPEPVPAAAVEEMPPASEPPPPEKGMDGAEEEGEPEEGERSIDAAIFKLSAALELGEEIDPEVKRQLRAVVAKQTKDGGVMVPDGSESCPTCGKKNGEGVTGGCNDPLGCGIWREQNPTGKVA